MIEMFVVNVDVFYFVKIVFVGGVLLSKRNDVLVFVLVYRSLVLFIFLVFEFCSVLLL